MTAPRTGDAQPAGGDGANAGPPGVTDATDHSAESAWRWCLKVADERRAAARALRPAAPGAQSRAAAAFGTATPSRSRPPDFGSPTGAAADLIDLYGPLLSLGAGVRCVVGHLGTSVDGRIATSDGDSCWVSGPGDLIHLHRMRALSDAVIVGATTVTSDDPLLTTRRVPGPDPVRIVLDPNVRTSPTLRVFDASCGPPTLLVCGQDAAARAAERVGPDRAIPVPMHDGELDLAAVLDALAARGLHVLFVEGGGATVSRLLQAGLLDRIQLAIAPVIVGAGRDGLRLPGPARMSDCARPPCRRFRLGEDVLFDYDLRGDPAAAPAADTWPRRID